jgi:hypothetical protein
MTQTQQAIYVDQPPLDDALTKPNSPFISPIWEAWVAAFYQFMTIYITQYGIFIPVLTNAQQTTIQAPVNGQMIYNSDTGTFQGYQAGAWKTFTLT